MKDISLISTLYPSEDMSEVREIPILLHDGTILRKKKDRDPAKRISEIIIEINKDGISTNERR